MAPGAFLVKFQLGTERGHTKNKPKYVRTKLPENQMNIRIRFALLELRHMVGIQSLVDINPYPNNFFTIASLLLLSFRN